MTTVDEATTVAVLRGESHTIEHEGETLKLAWRVVHPDFRSSHDYRWPSPGRWAVPSSVPGAGLVTYTRGDPCPQFNGDGICLALTFAGAASGSIVASTGLICAYRPDDVLGRDADKLRVLSALVLAIIDIPRLIRGANLSGANLSGANLSGVNLRGANLYGANLYGAYLRGVNLRGANLYGAYLSRAYLSGANLSGANLYGANLYVANLRRAYLSGVNLSGANLSGANLSGVNLRGVNLSGAYLSGAIGLTESTSSNA